MPAAPEVRLVFMGTPEFACPALASLAGLPPPYTLAAVITQPPRRRARGMHAAKSPIHQLAESHALAVDTPSQFDAATIARLESLAPDILVVVAYGVILPEAILTLPKIIAINAHASLLPRWRGAAPIARAIAEGDAKTGVTLMRITRPLDAGPILAQRAIPITASDTGGTMHDKLANLAASMLVEYMPSIVAGDLQETQQDESRASYAHKISSADTRLDFTQPTSQLLATIRAFAPRPGAWVIDLTPPQRRLTILAAEAAEGRGAAGVCLGTGRHGGPVFASADGGIELTAIKPAGKPVMTGSDYLNGNLLPRLI